MSSRPILGHMELVGWWVVLSRQPPRQLELSRTLSMTMLIPRLVTDRTAITAELKDEKSRRVEFFSGATDVLSALDHIGYKVIHHTLHSTGRYRPFRS